MTKRFSPAALLLTLAIAGFAVFFSVQLILHYRSFGSRSLDLGNMDQAIWNTLHGRPFHQTNQPGATSRLSLHVEPILIPVSWLYLIHSSPETLFVFQSIVVALGAIPVFALARHRLQSSWLALVFALSYLMFPAIQGAALLDFHAVTLAPTFLLAAFYFLERDRPRLFALFAVLAAACKEDMTLLVLMLGLYALLYRGRRRLGLVTIVAAGAWTVLAVFVIPPLFAGTQNIHWNRYGHLGDSPPDIVLNIFIRPQLFLDHLQAVNALTYLRLLLTPTAFTALLSPVTLLLALPSLGINLLSNFSPMQQANSLIYAAPVVPAVLISSIYGLHNLKRGVRLVLRRLPGGSRFRLSTATANLLLGGVVLAATLGYHARYGYFPWGGQFRGWEQVTGHHRRAAQIIAQIPPDAAVSAHDRLNPHVSQRETLYIFNRIDNADTVILDVTEDSWPLHPIELRDTVYRLLNNSFGVVDGLDGYLLLSKNPPGLPDTLPDAFYNFARVPNPNTFRPPYPANVVFDNRLKLLGYNLTLGAHEKFLPVISLYWQVLEPVDKDYTLWPFTIDRNGRVIEDPSERPLVATLWYPTSRWQPSEIIVTRTLPRDLAPATGDEFTLAVGVANGPWDNPANRLAISQASESLPRFDNQTWVRLGTFRRTGRKTYQPVEPSASRPQQPRQVRFWNILALQGVDLPQTTLRAGEELPFTLYWQAGAPITVNLKTFAHLLDENGQTVAQLDWTPQDALGYLPTSAWQPRQTVVDSQQLPLPANLPAGQYRLVVGWYYPVTGDRLPITGGNAAANSPNAAEIGSITIR